MRVANDATVNSAYAQIVPNARSLAPASAEHDFSHNAGASVLVTLSDAAQARLHEAMAQAPFSASGDAATDLKALQAWRQGGDSRAPNFDSALYTDPLTANDAGQMLPLFSMTDPALANSGTTLADALHDAMSSPDSFGTSSTQNAADLAMKKAKLEAIKAQYIPQSRQQDAQRVIDGYIDTVSQRQDALIGALWQSTQTLAHTLGDRQRAATADAALKAMAQGSGETQQERAQALAMVSASPDAQTFTQLKQLFRDGPDSPDAQYVDLLQQQWETFSQKYLNR